MELTILCMPLWVSSANICSWLRLWVTKAAWLSRYIVTQLSRVRACRMVCCWATWTIASVTSWMTSNWDRGAETELTSSSLVVWSPIDQIDIVMLPRPSTPCKAPDITISPHTPTGPRSVGCPRAGGRCGSVVEGTVQDAAAELVAVLVGELLGELLPLAAEVGELGVAEELLEVLDPDLRGRGAAGCESVHVRVSLVDGVGQFAGGGRR